MLGMADDDDRLMSSLEYARLLGHGKSWLFRMQKRGELPIKPMKIGRELRWSLREHREAVRRLSLAHSGATIRQEDT